MNYAAHISNNTIAKYYFCDVIKNKNTTGAVGIYARGDTNTGEVRPSRQVSLKQEKFKASSNTFGLEAVRSLDAQ
jgi:hypothetical protein